MRCKSIRISSLIVNNCWNWINFYINSSWIDYKQTNNVVKLMNELLSETKKTIAYSFENTETKPKNYWGCI